MNYTLPFKTCCFKCFSFLDVIKTDKGVYTCNLHHHYCQIHQSIQIQLNVTKSGEASVSHSLMLWWCIKHIVQQHISHSFVSSSERETFLGWGQECVCGFIGQLRGIAMCEQAPLVERQSPGGPAAGGSLGLPAPWGAPWQSRSLGGLVCLWRAPWLWTTLCPERDERDRRCVYTWRLLSNHLWLETCSQRPLFLPPAPPLLWSARETYLQTHCGTTTSTRPHYSNKDFPEWRARTK